MLTYQAIKNDKLSTNKKRISLDSAEMLNSSGRRDKYLNYVSVSTLRSL